MPVKSYGFCILFVFDRLNVYGDVVYIHVVASAGKRKAFGMDIVDMNGGAVFNAAGLTLRSAGDADSAKGTSVIRNPRLDMLYLKTAFGFRGNGDVVQIVSAAPAVRTAGVGNKGKVVAFGGCLAVVSEVFLGSIGIFLVVNGYIFKIYETWSKYYKSNFNNYI